MLFIAYGHLECVATLIKVGIPVDVLNNQGELPVHLAAGSGYKYILHLCLLIIVSSPR